MIERLMKLEAIANGRPPHQDELTIDRLVASNALSAALRTLAPEILAVLEAVERRDQIDSIFAMMAFNTRAAEVLK
jgi:hypothetical protein